jgi:hypothetical protein
MSTSPRGSLVRLRSGSHDLRVISTNTDGLGLPTVAVAWFTAAGEFRRAEFPAAALKPSPAMHDKPLPDAGPYLVVLGK